MGLAYERGRFSRAETAGGVVYAHQIFVDTMTVGGITVGQHPTDILPGMSFLKHVEIRKSEGLMTLVSKL